MKKFLRDLCICTIVIIVLYTTGSLDQTVKIYHEQIENNFNHQLQQYEVQKQDFHSEKSVKIELKPRKTDAVILLTQTRSGSSFLGEIFNRNPGVAYIYEPFYPVKTVCYPTEPTPEISEYFLKLLNYDFKGIRELYQRAFTMSKMPQINGCAERALCFTGFPKTDAFLSRDLGINIKNINLTELTEKMKKQKFFAIKVTRVCDVRDLEVLMRNPKYNVKIVHLVRDPRASINSMNKAWEKDFYASKSYEERCHHFETLLDYRHKKPGLLNQTNYMVVRHEDVCLNHTKWADKIYEFIGYTLDQTVKTWLEEATNSKQVDPFGTNRNTEVVLTQWRNQFDFSDVEKVQKLCANSMRKLGYTNFNTSSELTNLDLQSFNRDMIIK